MNNLVRPLSVRTHIIIAEQKRSVNIVVFLIFTALLFFLSLFLSFPLTELGQALSIRTDLVPEAYALSLRQLQDAVPPFSSEQAYDILRKEFRVDDLSRVFLSLSDKPVASASIGQVYRGVLAANGKEVAVKVQVSKP